MRLENKAGRRNRRLEQQSLLKLFPVPNEANKLVPCISSFNNKEALISFPRRMMLGRNNQIYISDSREHAIFIFGPAGETKKKMGYYGQGPGEFVEPSFISEAPQGKVAVLDSKILRIQFFDKQGNYLNSFHIFKPCFSMGIDKEGLIYTNLFDINNDAPLIHIFDESGRPSGQIGTRLKGNSPFFNEIEMSIIDEGVFIAWKTFPLIRKYSKSGKLLFEHYLDYGPLREYGDINKSAANINGRTVYKNIIWNIWAEKDFYYILIAFPRLEILKIDLQGKILKTYWDEVPDDFYASDFSVQREGTDLKIFILELGPVPHIRAYRAKE